MSVAAINLILASLTVAGQLIILSFIASPVRSFAKNHAFLITLLAAFIAMAGSLFYSEIAGYEPCNLCWYQRILMYPMAILLLAAIFKRDENIFRYTVILSGLGILLAGYHYLLQIGIAPEIPCSAIGYSASCAQRFVMSFGYITIPMMAFTSFALIFLTSLVKIYKTS